VKNAMITSIQMLKTRNVFKKHATLLETSIPKKDYAHHVLITPTQMPSTTSALPIPVKKTHSLCQMELATIVRKMKWSMKSKMDAWR
jgi:hypothetical protein